MGINLPAAPAAPDLNSPDTYNARVLNGFNYTFNTLPAFLAGVDAADWFSVQSNAKDTTPGRLMKVGAFGIGSGLAYGSTDNWDTIPPGFFGNEDATQAMINSPIAGNNRWAGIHAASGSNTAMEIATIGSTIRHTYMRGMGFGGVWTPWVTLYNSLNLVGPVSQVGGAVTGAIIERGANANGDYVRYADGTQICFHTLATSASASVTWTYPAPFTASPKVSGAAAGSTTPFLLAWESRGATSVKWNGFNLAGARFAVGADVMAVGRWY